VSAYVCLTLRAITACTSAWGLKAAGLIRTWTATHAARHDGAQLPALISKANTATTVWADTAYRSKANEQHLADRGLRSQLHRKKPAGRSMAKNVARANNA